MSNTRKSIDSIRSGLRDKNISFMDLTGVLKFCGFHERIKGDHHIFTKDNVEEIINIQPLGSKAKSYQVRQVRALLLKYKLGGDE